MFRVKNPCSLVVKICCIDSAYNTRRLAAEQKRMKNLTQDTGYALRSQSSATFTKHDEEDSRLKYSLDSVNLIMLLNCSCAAKVILVCCFNGMLFLRK